MLVCSCKAAVKFGLSSVSNLSEWFNECSYCLIKCKEKLAKFIYAIYSFEFIPNMLVMICEYQGSVVIAFAKGI